MTKRFSIFKTKSWQDGNPERKKPITKGRSQSFITENICSLTVMFNGFRNPTRVGLYRKKMELFELLTVPRILFQFHHFIWITLESAAFANILQNRLLKINP